MPRFKSIQHCDEFDKDVIITVRCKKVAQLEGGVIPTGAECSGHPNGRCGKCDICSVLKEAMDDVRSATV